MTAGQMAASKGMTTVDLMVGKKDGSMAASMVVSMAQLKVAKKADSTAAPKE